MSICVFINGRRQTILNAGHAVTVKLPDVFGFQNAVVLHGSVQT